MNDNFPLQPGPLNVDTLVFHPAKRSIALRSMWGAGPEDPVVLTVAKVAFEANLPLVARAFRVMRERLRTARLLIAGDDPDLDRMRRIFPEHLYGTPRDDERLAEFYASSDIILVPDKTQSFGRVVARAMASGLPVLTFNHGAGSLLLEDGKNGFLVDSVSDTRFIDRARESALDRGRWSEIGLAARRTIANIPWRITKWQHNAPRERRRLKALIEHRAAR